MSKPPLQTLLLIGGLDPSGGAGLTVDSAAARAQGFHALPVLTSLAIQNTSGVTGRSDVSAGDLESQLQTVAIEFPIAGVKIGLLPSADLTGVVLAWLKQHQPPVVVLDPVLGSGSGHALAEAEPRERMQELLPWVTVLTPNVHEAEVLAPVQSVHSDNTFEVMHALQAQGPRGVYLKGGHLTDAHARGNDFFLFDDDSCCLLPDRIYEGNVRGTGCALATHLACGLAQGLHPLDAATRTKAFMNRELANAYAAGKGRFLNAAASSQTATATATQTPTQTPTQTSTSSPTPKSTPSHD